jgi:hypothetical protein
VIRRTALALDGWSRRHEYLAATLVLLLVLAVWFWPALAGRHLGQSHILFDMVPWQSQKPADLEVQRRSSEGDAAFQFYPLLQIAREQLHAGHLPLWNPYSYAGTVLLGDMQTALLFPLTWIALVLPLSAAWGVMAILKLLLAGLGTYAFARQLGVGRGGGLVAGVVFMLCAPNLVWLQWPHTTVFALFGWLMLVTDRLYRRPGLTRAAAVAAVVALTILAGHPESAALGTLCATVYLVGLLLLSPGRRRAREALRTLGWWLGGHCAGLLAAAVVVLPFLEAFKDSASRTAHALQVGVGGPLHSVLQYAMPTVYGTGQPRSYGWDPFFASASSVAGYFGLVALILAGAAAWDARRRVEVRALVLLGLVAAALYYQPPPVGWIVEHVWPLNNVVVGRMYVYLAFIGALGAGAAVTRLSRSPMRPRAIVAWGGGLLVAVLALYAANVEGGNLTAPVDVRREAVARFLLFLALGIACLAALGRLRSRLVVPAVIVACALDLAYLHGYNVWLPPEQADPDTPPAAAFLQDRPEPFRLSPVEQPGRRVYPPNTSARDGLESVVGDEYPQSLRWAQFSATVLRQRGLTLERLTGYPVPRGASLTALRMLNVRYYLTAPGAPAPNRAFRKVYGGADASVYEDPDALPRAYVVPAVRTMSDAQALSYMSAGRLDPRRVALVSPGTAPLAPSSGGTLREARVRELAPDHVRVEVGAGPAGWLVLANAYRPQWRATIDGRDVEPQATNYAAVGVPVPAGSHVVELRVSRASFWLGALVSLLSASALVAAVLLERRRRTRTVVEAA